MHYLNPKKKTMLKATRTFKKLKYMNNSSKVEKTSITSLKDQ